MPIDYKKYPPNWKTEIRPAILKRANNCCEECGIENYSFGYRDKEGNFYDVENIMNAMEDRGYDFFEEGNELDHHYDKRGEPTPPTRIVLTIAHTCHDPMCTNPDHLKALCQYHHLHLDLHHNLAKRRKKLGMADLFAQ